MDIQDHQRAFIEFALENNIIQFGEFTLKSGRISPYFFNTGLFDSGMKLARLGQFYAQAILSAGIPFDMLYGPAYKGIPIASATAIALAEKYQRDAPFCFNRKETKDHGEGGILLGSSLHGRVLIIDDVISAGTSVNESVAIIRSAGAEPVGVVIALDRQERGGGNLSAIQEIQRQHGLTVHHIISLNHLLLYLSHTPGHQQVIAKIKDYMRRYGEILLS